MWKNIIVFKVLSFHSYIEIFQCENTCMIFLQRFTVPDVSMTSYVGFEMADEINACLSIGVTTTYDACRFLKYCAKLYHNYKSDQKCSCKIYIISKVTCFFVS